MVIAWFITPTALAQSSIAESPSWPVGEFVEESNLHALECIVAPDQICDLEIYARGHRLRFEGRWAQLTEMHGVSMGGLNYLRLDRRRGAWWNARQGWCAYDDCPPRETLKDPKRLSKYVVFEKRPARLTFDGGVLNVTWSEPQIGETELDFVAPYVTWNFVPRAVFDRKLDFLRRAFRPPRCEHGPLRSMPVPYHPTPGPCLAVPLEAADAGVP